MSHVFIYPAIVSILIKAKCVSVCPCVRVSVSVDIAGWGERFVHAYFWESCG